MKYFIFILLTLSLLSCEEPIKSFKSKPIKLRQLVTNTEKHSYESGSFFLIGGSYHKSDYEETSVKVFGRVDGYYRLIEMDINDIRINIDNSINKPNIVIQYYSEIKVSDSYLLSHKCYYDPIYLINCPEKYLPEKLLPIEL
jgi:hypothetical protein